MAKKIILDVDTGSDDAIAILAALASPELEVVAICTVAGNKSIDKTTENTLRVLDLASSDVPVFRGCVEPLVKGLTPSRWESSPRKTLIVDGEEIQIHDDYLPLPPSKRQVETMSAVEYYIKEVPKLAEPVTIIAVGPLTNLGAALTVDPQVFCQNVAEIYIMGGGVAITNYSPSAEFNIWFDPEAAQEVVNCGVPSVWVPLDATHEAYVTSAHTKRLRGGTKPWCQFAADTIDQRIMVHDALQPLAESNAGTVHDLGRLCRDPDGCFNKLFRPPPFDRYRRSG
ncbi:MAG TPA: nucleoside hydrolase [Clostridia bacterium]|nr:nucleoside hydrolase [Clostridia bacterium]